MEKKLYSRGFHLERRNQVQQKNSESSSEEESQFIDATKESVSERKSKNEEDVPNEKMEVISISESNFDALKASDNFSFKLSEQDTIKNRIEQEITGAVKKGKIIILQLPKNQYQMHDASYDDKSKTIIGTIYTLTDTLRSNTEYYKDTLLLLDVSSYSIVKGNQISVELSKINSIPKVLHKKSENSSSNDSVNNVAIFLLLLIFLIIGSVLLILEILFGLFFFLLAIFLSVWLMTDAKGVGLGLIGIFATISALILILRYHKFL